MKLTFTKGAGKHDRLELTRDDGRVEVVVCPKQRIIPHDMVHYAVESTLHARGFLGRVVAGESASFGMQAESDSDSVERLVEVFQGDAWSGSTTVPDDMIAIYKVTCEARSCPQLPVSAIDIISVRERINELDMLWAKIPVGEALDLALGGGTDLARRSAAQPPART